MDFDWRKSASMVVNFAVCGFGGLCGNCVGRVREGEEGREKNVPKMCQPRRHKLHAVIARSQVGRASASNAHIMIGASY